MMEIGVVGNADGWSSQRLVEAFESQETRAHLIRMSRVALDLAAGTAYCDDLDLGKLDAIVIKKIGTTYTPDLMNRLAALRYLAHNGVPVYSDPFRIKQALDRVSCTVTLRLNGIPIPDTVITEDVDRATEAVQRFGHAVLKPIYTSKARGMMLVEAGDKTREQVAAFKEAGNKNLYVQRKVDLAGRDYGLTFLGGEFVGAYARVAKRGSWNTTIHSGGKYEAFEPNEEMIDVARRAQAAFGLAFTCVDVGKTTEGLCVFEVSAFGGFRGLWQSCGVDAADLYARYVLKELHHDRRNMATCESV